MSKLFVAFLALSITGINLLGDDQNNILQSPDSRLAIQFKIISDGNAKAGSGQLVYSVTFHGKPLIDASKLSLTLQSERPLGSNLRIVNVTPSSIDQTYRLVTGKASVVQDHYNTLRLELTEDSGLQRKLVIEARAYNDAIAFRYVVPEQRPLRDFRLVNESTEFRISADATTYALELPNFRSMYESEFIKLPISAFANQGGVASKFLLGLPLLMEVPGVGWLAITEANLRDYSSMYLVNQSGGWSSHGFVSQLAPNDDHPELSVEGALPHHSAWRVLLIGDEPGRFIESNVITSLNPDSEVKDTSWIHAGRSSWDWWNGSIGPDGRSAYTTETMKYYVDFAAKQGLEYMLVDAGWYAKNDITKMNGRVDVPALVQYAKSKNVKVWIWIPYTLADAQMGEAFPLYAKWGVAGLKIDFIERDDQKGIDFYYRAARLAADHRLLLDFHGATKPTGLERTFPNVFGYEAVLGMEQSKGGQRDNPDNQLMLPFTRMLAGRMDYTPGGFDNVTKEAFVPRSLHPMVMGTRCHQLAMYAVFESPFQMVSDTPKAYEDQPTFQFIKDTPATWDETTVLAGEPGQFVTVARRKGAQWFMGSMTNWNARELTIPLAFLGKGKYLAEIYEDADDADRHPKNARVLKKTVDSKTVLHIQMAPAGGYAVRFVPIGK